MTYQDALTLDPDEILRLCDYFKNDPQPTLEEAQRLHRYWRRRWERRRGRRVLRRARRTPEQIHAHDLARWNERIAKTKKRIAAALAGVREAGADTGWIRVYRAIRIPSPEHINWHNIGSCWAYGRGGANVYQKAKSTDKMRLEGRYGHILVPNFLLRAYVKTDDVDWRHFICSKIEYAIEMEVRLKPGSLVTVVGYSYRPRRLYKRPNVRMGGWIMRSAQLAPVVINFPSARLARVHMECGKEVWRPRK